MRFRSLDANGDWIWGVGQQAYAQANAAIALSIKTRLLMVLNDCFFAPDGWIDWLNLLGSKNETALVFSIRSIIRDTAGVSDIITLSTVLNPRTRALSCNYTVSTIYGVSVQGSIVFNIPGSS